MELACDTNCIQWLNFTILCIYTSCTSSMKSRHDFNFLWNMRSIRKIVVYLDGPALAPGLKHVLVFPTDPITLQHWAGVFRGKPCPSPQGISVALRERNLGVMKPAGVWLKFHRNCFSYHWQVIRADISYWHHCFIGCEQIDSSLFCEKEPRSK